MATFFEKFKSWLVSIVDGIPAKVRVIASESLQVTNLIKTILNNPVADIVTAIIPGDWDDKLKATVLEALEKTMPYLQIVDACKTHNELGAMLECWVREVQKQPKHVQGALLHKLASLLTAMRDSKERKQNEYDYYIQALYSSAKELKQQLAA